MTDFDRICIFFSGKKSAICGPLGLFYMPLGEMGVGSYWLSTVYSIEYFRSSTIEYSDDTIPA